jgi:hypothetical protein
MRVLAVVTVVLAIASVIRVEHLLAGVGWIILRGGAWKRRVRRMKLSTQSDVSRMWTAYRDTDGGKLPFLFFGIKSYRLYNWSRSPALNRWQRFGLRSLRGCWRYYTFAPAMCVYVAALAVVRIRMPHLMTDALYVIGFSTVIGMLAIAAEAIFSAIQFESWAVLYHAGQSQAVRKHRCASSSYFCFVSSSPGSPITH